MTSLGVNYSVPFVLVHIFVRSNVDNVLKEVITKSGQLYAEYLAKCTLKSAAIGMQNSPRLHKPFHLYQSLSQKVK